MSGYSNDLYADAPDLVQTAIDAACSFPEGIIVMAWPPSPSEVPLGVWRSSGVFGERAESRRDCVR